MSNYFGNKGNNLIRLKEAGIKVPKFSLLGKDFFIKLLKEINMFEQAQTIDGKNGFTEQQFKQISKEIMETSLSVELENEIFNAVKDLKFPVSVRSSSSSEDGAVKSGAGMFFTSLNVTKENLIREVRKVLASLYDKKNIFLLPEQDFNPDKYYMGIVFQEMVNPEYSGVAFSSDPLTGDKNEILIEMCDGLGEKVVDGSGNVININVPRYESIEKLMKEFPLISEVKIAHELVNKYPFVLEVKDSLIKIEGLSNSIVDMEWAYLNGEVYILQFRPITTVKPKPDIEEIKVFSISKLSEETYPYLSYLQKRYPSWTKKAKFFDFCEKNNIKTNKWRFVVLNKTLMSEIPYEELFEGYDSNSVIYYVNSNLHKNAYTNEFSEKVKEFVDTVDDNSYCISVRENIPNVLSAISTISDDGKVHVEFFYGKMRSYNAGGIIPTRYVLDREGNVIERSVTEQVVWEFNTTTISPKPTNQRAKAELSDELLNKIFDQTKKMNSHFGTCASEWWIWNDNVYACDISILNNSFKSKNKQTISGGKYIGKIYTMPEIDSENLDRINDASGLSVRDYDEDTSRTEVQAYLNSVFEEWTKEGKIILHCEKPYLFLAPFLKYIGGFVFNNASSLCHLSLILREVGIPAISLNNDMIDFNQGQDVELNANKGEVVLL